MGLGSDTSPSEATERSSRIGLHRRSPMRGDRPVASLGDVSEPRLISVELGAHDPFATGDGQILAPKPDQSSGWNSKLKAGASRAERTHLGKPSLPSADPFGHHPDRDLREIADQNLHWLVDYPFDLFRHRLRV